MDDIIDYEAIERLADELSDVFRQIGEYLVEVVEKIGECLGEAIKIYKQNKTKYKPVKSLIKPYKQPFIKVRYRARANL
jgi:hypothetical protein